MADAQHDTNGDHPGAEPAPERVTTAIRAALEQDALPDETADLPEDGWQSAAEFIANVAMRRGDAGPAMALETLPGAAGARRMRLALVNDDMPFLVDSVAAAVSDAGLAIHRIVHPVLSVRRDAQGRLEDVAGRDAGGTHRESIIFMEVERADARNRRELLASVESVLADVRAAVVDWPRMQAAMQEDATRAADDEAAALLHWFLDRNFTQLAYERYERNGDSVGDATARLGIARNGGQPLLAGSALDAALDWFEQGGRAPLIVKSNRVSSVHRRVLIDLIILPLRGPAGIAGLSIHAGMWTSAALATPPDQVPVLRTALAELMTKFGFDPGGHAGKALAHVLAKLPHDLLVGADTAQLESIALAAMSIADRPRPMLRFILAPLQRHLFAFVWLPRDDMSTSSRFAIQTLLAERSNAALLGSTIAMEDGGSALLRYAFDLRGGGVMPDARALNTEIEAMVRGWGPGVESELARLGDEGRASALAHRFAPVFPQSYRLSNHPAEAARDIMRLRDIGQDRPVDTRLVPDADPADEYLRIKIYSSIGSLPLSRMVPALENFGFTVLEELPTPLEGNCYIHDMQLEGSGAAVDPARVATVERTIAEVLAGERENDLFNELTVTAAIAPRATLWLRAWYRYLRQTGVSYSMATFVQALRCAPDVTRGLVDLFTALHDPDAVSQAGADAARRAVAAGLDKVAAIDEDRILRLLFALVEATLRTNAFAPAGAEALAFKIDSSAVPGLPRPVPWREIFVYSPRVEGIHLRSGPVARGGLRWSDRRDDFRTEILGLMKAQRVKNAVIVPAGAKGGFHPKQLPDPASDRDAWMAEGTECYRIFIRSLLSVTDNIAGDRVIHPQRVVVRDGADPYFVVAADKGTASFSDVANAIALERDFWLGDAFASGGSNGYDHKAMGITARGGWMSVRRHFREMGIDVQSEPIDVVGVGDMSGDVFGNGMLLSKAIRLVAAFDHRHIFIDPAPDPARSWEERQRLFHLPRSSWADYDASLISKGGGVWPRSQKQIDLSPEARAVLGIEAGSIEPAELLSAILRAPVDLLWFGGIGTYVKAAAQNNAEVGDPANDRIRVNGEELRVRAVGEGANLGVTQAARIAYASRGGRINADFIDNSAGVDCSDNEVNIKIALNTEVREGRLELETRNALLEAMTDDVAHLVLEDNRLQALALSIAEQGGADALPSFIRLIDLFEGEGRLDRAVEGLAGNDDLLRRTVEGRGLTRPELAVVMATAKLAAQDAIEQHGLGADPLMDDELLAAFPPAMVERHRAAILAHQLRNEIVATKVANRIINRMGLIHPFELAAEEGVSIADIAEAFVVAERLLELPALWHRIDSAQMPEAARLRLYDEVTVELRAHMADLLRNSIAERSLAQCVADLTPGIRELDRQRDMLLRPESRDQAAALVSRLIETGTPRDVAQAIAHLVELDGAVGIVSLAQRSGADPVRLTAAFGALGHATGLDWAQGAAMRLSPSDPWERLLVAGLGRDFQQMRLDTIARLGGEPEAQVASWLERHAERVDQFRTFVQRARTSPKPSPAMLAQLAGQARTLLARA